MDDADAKRARARLTPHHATPEQVERAWLIASREEIRRVIAGACGDTVGDIAADAIDYHTDCDPWGWRGLTVVCEACDSVVLPAPRDVLDHGALAWNR